MFTSLPTSITGQTSQLVTIDNVFGSDKYEVIKLYFNFSSMAKGIGHVFPVNKPRKVTEILIFSVKIIGSQAPPTLYLFRWNTELWYSRARL